MIPWIIAGVSLGLMVWAFVSYVIEIGRCTRAETELLKIKYELMLGRKIK